MTWNIQNIRGKPGAAKAKLASEKIPEDAKTFISDQIDSLPDDVLGVVLNAYCQDSASPNALKLTRNIQITIDCVRV